MPDKWAQYAQPAQGADKWAQYAAPSGPPAAAGLPTGTHPAGLPAGMSLPGLPSAPNPANTAVARDTRAPIGTAFDAATNVGTHLKNMVAGPYHAFTDAPRNPEEASEMGTTPNSGVIATGLGHLGLGVARMFVNPTRDAIAALPSSHNPTDVMNHITDAIPVAGPWARNIENEAQQKGIVPALAGAATDAIAPEITGRILAAGARGTGFGLKLGVASPASRDLAFTRALTNGTPGELLQSALKPSVKYGADVSSSLDEGLPHVIAADPSLNGVSGFASAADSARNAAHAPFQSLLDQTKDMPVSTQSLADAARGSVSRAQEIENPLTGAVQAANRHAGIYDDKFAFTLPDQGLKGPYLGPNLNIGDLDAVRSTKNAQLQNLFADTPADRASVLKANPTAARLKALRDEAADTQYGTMSGLTGVPQPEIQDMQDRYGLLRDVSDIANKREPVFARHDPVTLSQKIASAHGGPLSAAWNYLVQSKLGDLTNSDALVNSAVDRFQNPGGTPLTPRPGVAPKIASGTGSALRAVPAPPLLLNPFFTAPASGQR